MIKTMACLVFVLAASAAWAQDRPQNQNQGQEWMLNRMKERLGLSDEQFEKVKQVYTQTREAEEKAQKEREEKIKELLNDDQKKQYDELRRNPTGRGGMGGGLQGGNMMERLMAPGVDVLKKELTLTDEQAEKIKAHLEEFNQKARERFEEMQQNGFRGFNWQDETQKFQERVKEMGEKVKAHLTDEQKAAYDKFSESRFTIPNMGNRGVPGGREGGRPNRPPVEERVRRVMESLKMDNAEEAAAVRELVTKVVTALNELEDVERATRTSIDELGRKADASEEEIKAKIDELRGQRREKDKGVRDAQKSLSEVVTYRQELELIRAGVLK